MQSSRSSHPSRAVFGLLALGLLLITPLAFYRGFAEQFTTLKWFLTEALVLAGIAWAGWRLVRGTLVWPANFPLAAPLGFFCAAVVVSCVAAPDPAFSFREAEYFLCGPAWLLLLSLWDKDEANARWLAILITFAGTVASGIALLQWSGRDVLQFGGYFVDWGSFRPAMRVYSTFGNPNFAAGYLIGAIFLALALGWTAAKTTTRAAAFACAAIMFAAILGTRSRGAWLALACGLVVLRISSKSSSRVAEMREAGGTGNGLRFFLLPMVVALFAPQLAAQARALVTHLEGRLFLARAAWPMFASHPLFGGGWGNVQIQFLELQAQYLSAHPESVQHWTIARDLHNDPLQILLEAGAVGFVAFAWFVWAYFREARRATDSPAIRIWLAASAAGVTAILVDSLLNFQFAIAPTLILLFTLMAFPGFFAAREFDLDVARRTPGKSLAGIALFLLAAFLSVQLFHRVQSEIALGCGLKDEHRGNAAAAEQSFRQGSKIQPGDGRLSYGLARVLYRQERSSEALAEALKAERTIADSHLEVLKARCVDHLGFAPQALELYRHALWLDPTLKSVPDDIRRLTTQETHAAR